MENLIALVTGTGHEKGLGYASGVALLKQGYHVIFVSRKLNSLQTQFEQLSTQFPQKVFTFECDLQNNQQIDHLYRYVQGKFSHLNVLLNNAGIFEDFNENEDLTQKMNKMHHSFETNTLGPIKLMETFKNLLFKAGSANVVNVSSGMGQLSEMSTGYIPYRVSKTALNAVTKIYSEAWKDKGVRVNSVCPGWVKTKMGGEQAQRSIEEGIKGIVWAATLNQQGPTGGFFRDGKALSW